MDGTRDRPPGKAAENWGRRDGIRAGSVTGPWRSGPRGAAPEPARQPAAGRAQAADSPETPGDDTRAYRRAYADEHHARAQRWLAGTLWIAFGVILAVGLVIVAFMLRPDPGELLSRDREDFVPATGSAEAALLPAAAAGGDPAATADVPAALAVLQTVQVVRLRIGPGFPTERQDAIVAALEGAGVPDVRIEALPFRIATSRVGYYRAEDLAAAEALGRLVAPVIAGGDSDEIGVRDYGQLLSDPEPGRLDLWVGG